MTIAESIQTGAWNRSDVFSLAEMVLTFLGFALAIWQLQRTRTATQDTNKRLKALATRLAGNDLLVALPELQRIEHELDLATKQSDQREIERLLKVYARHSGQLLEMIDATLPEEGALVAALSSAKPAAMTAVSAIMKEASTAPRLTKAAVMAIVIASPEVSAAVARQRRRVTDDG